MQSEWEVQRPAKTLLLFLIMFTNLTNLFLTTHFHYYNFFRIQFRENFYHFELDLTPNKENLYFAVQL